MGGQGSGPAQTAPIPIRPWRRKCARPTNPRSPLRHPVFRRRSARPLTSPARSKLMDDFFNRPRVILMNLRDCIVQVRGYPLEDDADISVAAILFRKIYDVSFSPLINRFSAAVVQIDRQR